MVTERTEGRRRAWRGGAQGGPGGPRPANDARRFGRNVASAGLAQLVAQLLTLLVSIVLARRLDVSAYGLFAFGFAFPSWFLLLVSLGLDEVMATDVAADRSKASKYLTMIGLVRLALCAIAMIGLWIGTYIVLRDPLARTITIILGASSVITTYAGTFSSVFRAFERQEYGAIVTIVERLVTATAALVLLLSGRGLLEVSLVFLGGSFVTLALSCVTVRSRFTWFTRDIDRASVARLLRRAIPFGLYNTLGTFSYTIGAVLLTVLHSPGATGLFNASLTLLFALFSLLSIVSLTTLPMMSRIDHESRERLAAVLRRMQKLALIAGVPLAFGGWFYAEAILTTFYGTSFRASAESFRVLVLSFAVGTATVGIGPALVATRHMTRWLAINVVGAVVAVVLSLALVPGFGPVGAACAFLASSIVTSILGGLAVRRLVAPLGVSETIAKSLLAGSTMLFVLLFIPGLSLWTGMAVGGLVYFAALLGLRGLSSEDRTVVRDAIRGALYR